MRIQPILKNITFKKIESEDLRYANGKLYMYQDIPLKCLKIIQNRYKVYVDFGFKGNSRYANDKSDYYVVDEKEKTLLFPSANDYGSIVATLERMAEEQTPLEEQIAPLVDDTKIMLLTIQNLINEDGWHFTQAKNGNIFASNNEEEKVFEDGTPLKKWLFKKAEEF